MGIDHTAVLAYGVKVTLPEGVDAHPEEYFEEVAARYNLKLITAGTAEGGVLEYVIGALLGKAESRYSHPFVPVDVAPSDTEPPLARVKLALAVAELREKEKDLNPVGPGFFLGLHVW